MGNGISSDLRRRVIEAWQEEGLTTRALAERFKVGAATVTRWKALYRETGDVLARPHGGGRPRKIPPECVPLLEALITAHPDWTEDEYAQALFEQQGIEVAANTTGRYVRELGWVSKKRLSEPANGTEPPFDNGDASTLPKSQKSPVRVWFSWTKRV